MSDQQIHQQLKSQALKSDNSFELLPRCSVVEIAIYHC